MISFSKSYSRDEFFSEIFSSSSWRLCILRCYSYSVFWSSLSFWTSIYLAFSISWLIRAFLFISLSFSVLRFLNLFCSASMSANSRSWVVPGGPPCPDLSYTMDSRKLLNFSSCRFSSSLRLRFSLVSSSFTLRSSICTCFSLIILCSFSSFASSYCFMLYCLVIVSISFLTRLIIRCYSSLNLFFSNSNFCASAMICSF